MSDELGVSAGQVIAGKYRVEKLLGKGGMGSVWLCQDQALMSRVALKVIKPEVAKNANSVARFMREAKAAAMLRSPHVVQVLEHGQEGAIAYIAMELLEGESLHRRLKRQGKVSAPETARVLTHVGRAMQKAHDAGIVHRDLKPDNVFLVQNDDEIVAKVLDFGIAKSSVYALNQTGESPQTQTGALLGTPYYMSPEQATGQKDVDHRSDLWAISVIAFECLLGRRPYQSDSLGDLVLQICTRTQPVPSSFGSVPLGFDQWFERAQSRDPDGRFQSAKELTTALREVLTGSSKTSARSLPRPSVPPPRRSGQPDVTDSSPFHAIPLMPSSRIPSELVPSQPSQPVPSQPVPSQPVPSQPVPSQPVPSGPVSGDPRARVPSIPGVPSSPSGVGGGLHVGSSGAMAAHTAAGASSGFGSDAARSGGHGIVELASEISGSAAADQLGLETLDPLAATNAPKSRRGLLLGGVIGAIFIVGGLGAVMFFGPREHGPSSATPTVEPATAGPDEPGTRTAAGTRKQPAGGPTSDLVTSAEAAPSASAPPSATASGSAAPEAPHVPRILPKVTERPKPQPPRPYPPRPQPPRPQPPRPQPPKPQPPPPPPPPQDPLGI